MSAIQQREIMIYRFQIISKILQWNILPKYVKMSFMWKSALVLHIKTRETDNTF